MPPELFRHVYAVAADSAESAIETAWKYATATDAARELHEYPVALHKDDIPPRIKTRYVEVYRIQIAITSLRHSTTTTPRFGTDEPSLTPPY